MYGLLRMGLRCPGVSCLVCGRSSICLLRMTLFSSPQASWQFGFENAETFSPATLCKQSADSGLAPFQPCKPGLIALSLQASVSSSVKERRLYLV